MKSCAALLCCVAWLAVVGQQAPVPPEPQRPAPRSRESNIRDIHPDLLEMADEPCHTALLETQDFRVFRMTIAGQQKTQGHFHHNPYFMMSLTDGVLGVTGETAGEKEYRVSAGDIRFLHGEQNQPKIERNRGTTPYRNLTIEIMAPGIGGDVPSKLEGVPLAVAKDAGKSFTESTKLGGMWLRRVQVLPGETISVAKQPYILMLALTDLQLRLTGPGEPALLNKKKGEVEWLSDGLTETVANTGSQPAQWVTIAVGK